VTEYLTTRKSCRAVGVEKATTIEPPDGFGWKIINVSIADDSVFFFWQRESPYMEKDPVCKCDVCANARKQMVRSQISSLLLSDVTP
jgi:hypothetical protein